MSHGQGDMQQSDVWQLLSTEQPQGLGMHQLVRRSAGLCTDQAPGGRLGHQGNPEPWGQPRFLPCLRMQQRWHQPHSSDLCPEGSTMWSVKMNTSASSGLSTPLAPSTSRLHIWGDTRVAKATPRTRLTMPAAWVSGAVPAAAGCTLPRSPPSSVRLTGGSLPKLGRCALTSPPPCTQPSSSLACRHPAAAWQGLIRAATHLWR